MRIHLALFSCKKATSSTDNGGDSQEGGDPTFENTSATEISLPEEGGDFTITYTITNPVENEQVEDNINVDRITLKESSEGSLEFTAAANPYMQMSTIAL